MTEAAFRGNLIKRGLLRKSHYCTYARQIHDSENHHLSDEGAISLFVGLNDNIAQPEGEFSNLAQSRQSSLTAEAPKGKAQQTR